MSRDSGMMSLLLEMLGQHNVWISDRSEDEHSKLQSLARNSSTKSVNRREENVRVEAMGKQALNL